MNSACLDKLLDSHYIAPHLIINYLVQLINWLLASFGCFVLRSCCFVEWFAVENHDKEFVVLSTTRTFHHSCLLLLLCDVYLFDSSGCNTISPERIILIVWNSSWVSVAVLRLLFCHSSWYLCWVWAKNQCQSSTKNMSMLDNGNSLSPLLWLKLVVLNAWSTTAGGWLTKFLYIAVIFAHWWSKKT